MLGEDLPIAHQSEVVPIAAARQPFEAREVPSDLLDSYVKPRPRLLGNKMLRGAISILGGPGGVGKSSLQLGMAVSLAVGRDLLELADGYELRPRSVLLLNNEDDIPEIELRLRGFARSYALKGAELELLRCNLFYQSGTEASFRLCRVDDTGAVLPTSQLREIESYCVERGIDAVLVDPLVSLHDANENDNSAMESVLTILRGFARRCQLGICLAHHTKKGAGPEDVDGAFRGASGVVNAARSVMLLTRMTPKEEQDYVVPSGFRSSFVRLDDGKQNYSLPADKARWYRLEAQGFQVAAGVESNDVEYVGVPVPVELTPRDEESEELDVSSLLQALDDQPWPLRLTDYYGTLRTVFGVNSDSSVRRHLESLPIRAEGATEGGLVGNIGPTCYRVWRLRSGRGNAMQLAREVVK